MNLFSRFSLRTQRHFTLNLLKLAGVGAVCFAFEACYGVPQADYPGPLGSNTEINGCVKSADGSAIANAEVLFTRGTPGDTLRTTSDQYGKFHFEGIRGDFRSGYLRASTKDHLSTSKIITKTGDPRAANTLYVDLLVENPE